MEKGLTFLSHSSLAHTFWEHAFKTDTYLYNRTITPTLAYNLPYQKLYSKIPDYELLKTFGCLCYSFLWPYNHHKMEFIFPCIFIGYSASHKGYLFYHHPSSHIYIARHVVFNEDVFPSIPDSSISPSNQPASFSTSTFFNTWLTYNLPLHLTPPLSM